MISSSVSVPLRAQVCGATRKYVEASGLTLQRPQPDDFVVATGETDSVGELCEVAFSLVGLDSGPCVQVDAKYMPRQRSTSSAGTPRRPTSASADRGRPGSATSCA